MSSLLSIASALAFLCVGFYIGWVACCLAHDLEEGRMG